MGRYVAQGGVIRFGIAVICQLKHGRKKRNRMRLIIVWIMMKTRISNRA